jgi:hypothetical protein
MGIPADLHRIEFPIRPKRKFQHYPVSSTPSLTIGILENSSRRKKESSWGGKQFGTFGEKPAYCPKESLEPNGIANVGSDGPRNAGWSFGMEVRTSGSDRIILRAV